MLNDRLVLCKWITIYKPGTLAYYSDRNRIEMMGLVTPAVAVKMKNGHYSEISGST